MDEFRPEYVQALDAARWNFWWYVAAVIPILLLVPAAAKRRLGCLAFPLAYFLSWVAFCCAVEYYWTTKEQHAATGAEWADVTADTGRLFGPVLVGVPLVVIYVSLVAGLIYATAAIVRRLGRQPEP